MARKRKTLSNEEFLTRAQAIHGDKYEYLEECPGYKKKIRIRCRVHDFVFSQRVGSHLSGDGCRKCSNAANSQKQKGKKFEMRVRTHAQFITQSMVVHNGKYEYLSDYTRTDALIDIRCPKHGVFQQTPHQHLRGAGCRSCADEYRASLHRKNPDKYVAECNIIHNGKYTYDMTTYINTHSNVRIICPLHGEFQQMALHHWHGSECPTCAIGSNVSKQETDWLDSLNINKEYRNPKLYINDKLIKPDAYIPETNTIYEFYGDYWHGNPNVFDLTATNEMAKKTFQELYSATMERAQLIKNAGYNLICIWECEWEAMCKSA